MDLKRRDFNKMLLAAAGGVMAGATFGCGDKKDAATSDAAKKTTGSGAAEKHACKGLNSCKGNGGCKTDKNECKGHNTCKGSGGCATVEHHACAGKNGCKGQGGCGGKAGKNECSGKGGCAVPVKH